MEVPYKTKNITPYDPAIPLLGIHPEKTKITNHTSIPVFTAALFTISETWKQPKCPSTEEWIKKIWHVYTWNITQPERGTESCHLQRQGRMERLSCRVKCIGKRKIPHINAYMWHLEKWYRWTYLKSRNRDRDTENKRTDTRQGKGSGMSWEIGLGIHTLPWIKWVLTGT